MDRLRSPAVVAGLALLWAVAGGLSVAAEGCFGCGSAVPHDCCCSGDGPAEAVAVTTACSGCCPSETTLGRDEAVPAADRPEARTPVCLCADHAPPVSTPEESPRADAPEHTGLVVRFRPDASAAVPPYVFARRPVPGPAGLSVRFCRWLC